jgi:hypothetical protein
MQQSVRDQFAYFSAGFESRVPVMYLDIKGLVTTGIGNLIDPMSAALVLPWRDCRSNVLVSRDEIAVEWERVKALQSHSEDHTSFWISTAQLRLSTADIDVLVMAKLEEFEAALKARLCFAAWESWPADAQLGTLSMAWAMGPAFNYPHFEAACRARDFSTAAAECFIPDATNPGLAPRDKANLQLFTNAAAVEKDALDPAILYYPRALSLQVAGASNE